VLDPCAGTGAALLAVTKDATVARYAIELDTGRAEACSAAGINTIHGNTIEVAGKVQQVSLLYLNPPYDFEIGASDNKRLEQVFLQHCYRWLADLATFASTS
jgi:predicted RNA methylase